MRKKGRSLHIADSGTYFRKCGQAHRRLEIKGPSSCSPFPAASAFFLLGLRLGGGLSFGASLLGSFFRGVVGHHGEARQLHADTIRTGLDNDVLVLQLNDFADDAADGGNAVTDL